MQRLILAIYHLLLFATPLFFLFKTDELFEFNKMILVYALALIVLMLWLFRMVLEGKIIWKRTTFDIPIALFLASQVLSTLLSMHSRTSWLGYYGRFHGGLFSWISYTILYYAFVNNVPKKTYKTLFLTASLSALAVSIYAILEHFGHSTSCLLVTKGKSFGVDCWIQKVQDRVFATFGQPNWLAGYLITLLPLTMVALVKVKNKAKETVLKSWQWWFFYLTFIAEFLALLFTKSRSGFLGLAGGVVALGIGAGLVFYQNFSKNQDKSKSKMTTVLPELSLKNLKLQLTLIIVGLLAVGATFGTPYSPSVGQLLKGTNQSQDASTKQSKVVSDEPKPAVNRLEEGGTDSGEIRKIVWEGALKVWKRYPIFGSGVETFAYSYYRDRPVAHNLVSEWDFLYNKAHNEPLNFLATTGLVGLTTYLLIFSWLGVVVLKGALDSKTALTDKLILIAILAGLIAQSISNFFGFSTVMVTVLLFLYLGAIAEKTRVQTDSESDSKNYSKHKKYKPKQTLLLWQYAGICAISITSAFMLSKVYFYWSADADYSMAKKLSHAGSSDRSIDYLTKAIKKSPSEALYYDQLSGEYADIAIQLAKENYATQSAQAAQLAILASDTTLELNPNQLNFYKTRARVFATLSQLEPKILEEAQKTLIAALEKSPTDAKLWYNLGVVLFSLDQKDQAIAVLEKAIELKPDYGSARYQLAQAYERVGNLEEALKNYQFILDNLNPNDQKSLEAVERISTASTQVK